MSEFTEDFQSVMELVNHLLMFLRSFLLGQLELSILLLLKMPPTPSAASLPELVKKFGQIEIKLQSPSPSFESHSLQKAGRIFKDWMKRDFTASFSLKVLHDAEKAYIKIFKAQLLSKAQYECFVNFFENLWALKDKYQKAERASNRVKCFQEKHVKTSATLQQLVEEISIMKDRIAVVDAEIQRLEKQFSSLKSYR